MARSGLAACNIVNVLVAYQALMELADKGCLDVTPRLVRLTSIFSHPEALHGCCHLFPERVQLVMQSACSLLHEIESLTTARWGAEHNQKRSCAKLMSMSAPIVALEPLQR